MEYSKSPDIRSFTEVRSSMTRSKCARFLHLHVWQKVSRTYNFNMAAPILRCTFGRFTVSILKKSIKTKPTVPVLDHNVPLRHFNTLKPSYRNTNGLLPLASAFLGTSQSHDHGSAPILNGQQKRQLSDDSRKRSLRLMDFPEVVLPTLMTRIRNMFFSVLIKGYFDEEFTTTSFLEGAQQVVRVKFYIPEFIISNS